MGALTDYFRKHRWQRRMITSLAALIAGLGAAVAAWPHVREYTIIYRLGSDDPAVRQHATARAISLARVSDRMAGRLDRALATDNDVKFAAICRILQRVGRFDAEKRDPLQIDRLRAIQLAAAYSSVETRRDALLEVILTGRDNRFVRRALAAAAADPAPEVRGLSSLLAAKLGDVDTAARLLSDKQTSVAAFAALDAGLSGQVALAGRIEALLDSCDDPEVVSASAYALALLRPAESSARIAALLEAAGDAALRDRLLHVMTVLKDEPAERAVLAAIRAARGAQGPPAMALVAAGKLRLAAAGADVRNVLAAAGDKSDDFEPLQLLAAIEAADRLHLPVRAEMNAICRRLWSPRFPTMLAGAARLLGEQAQSPQPGRPDPPTLQACVDTLLSAAAYRRVPATHPAGASSRAVTTPVASAAAAVALWRLRRPGADEALRRAAASGSAAGDYVAWHVGTTGEAEAFALGLTMLPALDAPAELKQFNDDVRAAGAMLLALSAGTDRQKATAIQRITRRLVGGNLGGEDNLLVRWTYQCALLILGQTEHHRDVRQLLGVEPFSRLRVLAALLTAGDRKALDWLLWNRQHFIEDAAWPLADEGLADVLARLAPELPTVDPAGDEQLVLWQVRILRRYYAIHREKIRLGRP